MATYYGSLPHGGDTSSEHFVIVVDDIGRRLLTHHVRHSPTGYSWGYYGSGPAELAKDILWEHLDEEPHPACYQDFKTSFVALWPQGEGWTLHSVEIDEWLSRWRVRHPDHFVTIPEQEAFWEREAQKLS